MILNYLSQINDFCEEVAKIYLKEFYKFEYSYLRYSFDNDFENLSIIAFSTKKNVEDKVIYIKLKNDYLKTFKDTFVAANYIAQSLIDADISFKENLLEIEKERKEKLENSLNQKKILDYQNLQKELKEKGLI